MENSVTKILDAVPHDAICRRLMVAPRSIRLVKERGVFPANWYSQMKSLCREHGVECPEGIFNWKSPAAKTSEGAE